VRFKVKFEFKGCGHQFEVGNTHNSVLLDIREDDVKRWYRAGWVDIEGYPIGPSARPEHTEIAVQKLKVSKAITAVQ